MAIEPGTLIRVGGRAIPITTMNAAGRFYHREKTLRPGHFLFGTVEAVYEVEKERWEKILGGGEVVGEKITSAKLAALVQWAGPKYRTSVLPLEALQPAKKS